MKNRANVADAKWQDVKAEMRTILIEQAKAGHTITYSELSNLLQTAYVHYHSHLMTRLLIEIGSEEVDAGRPVLPALVVTKQTGIPGAGYFKNITGEITLPESQWADDLQGVYDYWSQH